MKIYFFNEFYVFEDLQENFLNLMKYTKVNNKDDADIYFFHNFTLENRKFLLNNKPILNSKMIICYFHEPLTLQNIFCKKILKRVSNFKQIKILTYSFGNYKILKNKLVNKINYLPINYYFEKDINYSKIYNIGTYHRNYNQQYNNKNYNLELISKTQMENNNIINLNLWGKEREKFLSSLKIFINLHKEKTSSLLETLRIHELIKFRVIVISQKCYDYFDPLSKYVIFVDDKELVNKANEVLYNYNHYYKKIYGNLTNKEIFGILPKNI